MTGWNRVGSCGSRWAVKMLQESVETVVLFSKCRHSIDIALLQSPVVHLCMGGDEDFWFGGGHFSVLRVPVTVSTKPR